MAGRRAKVGVGIRGGVAAGRDGRARLALGLTAAFLVVSLSGCGAGVSRTPGGVTASTTGAGSGNTVTAPTTATRTAKKAATGRGALRTDPALRYAAYYRADGTATVIAGQPLAMKASDFAFSPNTLSVAAGTAVHLKIDNVSTQRHNFDLPGENVNVNLPAGATTSVVFTPTHKGSFYFYCNLPGHAAAGMVGKITIR